MTMSNAAGMAAIAPILIVMITGMVVLLGDSCIAVWRKNSWVSPTVGLAGVTVAFMSAGLMIGQGGVRTAFNGAITADAFSQACNIILLVIAALAILLASTYLENRDLHHGEYYSLVLFSTSGAMLMAAASELIVLFVAIEILSVALYVLAGFARTEPRSEEAALKYFLLGAFAAGFSALRDCTNLRRLLAQSVTGNVGTTNLECTWLLPDGIRSSPSIMLIVGVGLLLGRARV